MSALSIHTVGHSTRTIDDFIALLRGHRVERLVDVRAFPGSRRNPQFAQANLRGSLAAAGIDYRHVKALGGMRKPAAESVNRGWRNPSFRAYADHMQTPEFARAIEQLLELARTVPTAIMCAEALPSHCHRSLIGDALLARGVDVVDIIGAAHSEPHALTSFAHVAGTRVTYPTAQGELPL